MESDVCFTITKRRKERSATGSLNRKKEERQASLTTELMLAVG